jgi:hypothetical protein
MNGYHMEVKEALGHAYSMSQTVTGHKYCSFL